MYTFTSAIGWDHVAVGDRGVFRWCREEFALAAMCLVGRGQYTAVATRGCEIHAHSR